MGFKISGMGLLCGLGNSPTTVFDRMCAGTTAFRQIYTFEGEHYAQKLAGQLEPADNERLLELFEGEDRALAMVRMAALQALGKEATPDSQPMVPRRALVLATNFGPMETLQWCWQERLDTQGIDDYTYAPAQDYIRRLAALLGCGGPALQLSMSCASGAAAVAAAWDLLATRRADSVLVVAYDSLSDYSWCGLSNLKTITLERMRPFDSRRSGTIFSEGAAAILLEPDSSPAPALGWVNGVATGNNAFHLTAPRPEAAGSRQVMEAALASAGVSGETVQHVCAHATSTSANDATEAAAIRNVLGEHVDKVMVSAFKSQLGHLLGAAGLAEVILAVESMRRGIYLPIVGLEQPDPKCLPLRYVTQATPGTFQTTLTNSAGIGGNNAATLLGLENSRPSRFLPLTEKLCIRSLGWVLPSNIGSGQALLEHPEWLDYAEGCNAKLHDFNAKPYLSSVKGYLDAGGAYFLAACSMAMAGTRPEGLDSRRGIASASCYGSARSAFSFYAQFLEKGSRFASPMIFPHGYANTPGNLAAIEYGFAGPHTVLYGPQNVAEALMFAYARLLDGSADEMLVGFYEAPFEAAFPDSLQILGGAVVLRLALQPAATDLGMLDAGKLCQVSPDATLGSLQQLKGILRFW